MKKNFLIMSITIILVLSGFNAVALNNNVKNSEESVVISESLIKKTENQNEYWGLLIAVGVYADDPNQNRPLMLDEVDEIYDVLLDSPWWQQDHIKVIKGEDATVTNIIQGFRWLDEMEDSDDISLVYITTHGFPLGFDIPPADENDGTDEALISYWGFAYPSFVIWDDVFNVLLNRLESEGVCFIVDSCYAGGFNDPPDWNLNLRKMLSYPIKQDDTKSVTDWMEGFAEDVKGQGRVVLMASSEDEVSFSGGFAPYLIDGLRGYADSNMDNIISAEEAFYYTEPRTNRQHPTIYDGYPGELPLINTNIESNSKEENGGIDVGLTLTSSLNTENSIICGYITDSNTDEPIENAYVEVLHGDNWDGDWNETFTDSTGFYSFNVAAGNVMIFAEAEGYLTARTDRFNIGDYELLWVNLSLELHPPENSEVFGYITDAETGYPIKDANVILQWGNWIERYWNETFSDSSGFYSINAAAGEISLTFDSDQYITKYLGDYQINDFETLQIDVEMSPRPPENSKIKGYITDSETHNPIENARVYLEWHDEQSNILEYHTSTDSSGFYSIDIAAGETYIEVEANEYRSKNMYRNDVGENDVLWLNTSIDKDIIQVDISNPLKAIYFSNERFIPSSNCIIFGSIEVEAFIHDFWYRSRHDVSKVEFYLDENLQETVYSEPFIWTWVERSLGKHNLKVIAYDDKGHAVEDELQVLKLL